MLAEYTDITILLDASASMARIKDATRESLVNFIKEQQAVPGEATLTLVEFHDRSHVYYKFNNIPVKSIKADQLTYNPTGSSTALRDAWLQTMAAQGKRFANMSEATRPNKVIYVVLTDGQDNASVHSRGDVHDAVKIQADTYKWQFIYLGANQDAEFEGQSYGLHKDSALTFVTDNMVYANGIVSDTVASYRQTGSLRGFSADVKMAAIDKNLIDKKIRITDNT